MNNTNNNGFSVRRLAQMALLIALEIIFSRFVSIATPIVKISFSFLPLAAMAILYGPAYAAAGGAIADFLGAILFPIGAYFPGFTLTAALTGAVYGVFLQKNRATVVRTLCAVLVINFVIQLGIDTLWLVMITDKAFLALLPVRALKCALMVPVQVLGIKSLDVLLKTTRRAAAAG